MEILIIVFMAGLAAYFLFKVGLYLYRPFLLRKMLFDIEAQYNNLLVTLNKEINTKEEDYKNWKSGKQLALLSTSEDELTQRIRDAIESKKHEQEVNEKFIRLRERSIGNYKKLAEAILWYKRYLSLKKRQSDHAQIYTGALSLGGMTFDEFVAAANEDRIAIEESERRLDILLNSNP